MRKFFIRLKSALSAAIHTWKYGKPNWVLGEWKHAPSSAIMSFARMKAESSGFYNMGSEVNKIFPVEHQLVLPNMTLKPDDWYIGQTLARLNGFDFKIRHHVVSGGGIVRYFDKVPSGYFPVLTVAELTDEFVISDGVVQEVSLTQAAGTEGKVSL
jgi:hypothetical protein